MGGTISKQEIQRERKGEIRKSPDSVSSSDKRRRGRRRRRKKRRKKREEAGMSRLRSEATTVCVANPLL